LIYADEATIDIDEWTTGVARVDRCGGLQQPFEFARLVPFADYSVTINRLRKNRGFSASASPP
jgi:hypothetical protein